ncbi:phosphatase PAP2 family protein [Rhizobacter sp. AJA081-3]|uniref:phosphatase PAP2 family protein n=1 Tax=Rhizobacter sp. AJA081-3 TaxID=2753607 RepID=UPI001AE0AF1E|nr:phosphatase PAP2 family protein [Rhizobacter sp. AJA081-3]QTN22034.1 phosphatase PAP2 family protein [Rhizobacter sp. AJA081-3]
MPDFAWAHTLDTQVALAIAKGATPGLRAFMEGLSAAHGPRGIAVLTAAVAALLIADRQRADALWLLLVVFGGATLNHLLKHTIQRPRPGMEYLGAVATDFSFPSGHAANTTLLYGAMAVLLIRHVRAPGLRALPAAFAGSVVLLVGSSRLVLGAHRFSDVAAGVLLGVLVLAIGEGVRRALQR